MPVLYLLRALVNVATDSTKVELDVVRAALAFANSARTDFSVVAAAASAPKY